MNERHVAPRKFGARLGLFTSQAAESFAESTQLTGYIVA